MKNKIIYIILVVGFLLGVVGIIYLYYYNSILEEQINKRDVLISQMNYRDSLYINKINYYSETLNDYIKKNKFVIDGKEMSNDEFIEIFNKVLYEKKVLQKAVNILNDTTNYFVRQYNHEKRVREAYQNEFNKYYDSTLIYRIFYSSAKEYYGIDFSVRKDSTNKYIILDHSTKADSGLLLLPYYRNKLRYDSLGRKWIITLDKE